MLVAGRVAVSALGLTLLVAAPAFAQDVSVTPDPTGGGIIISVGGAQPVPGQNPSTPAPATQVVQPQSQAATVVGASLGNLGTVAPGQSFTLTGAGFVPGATVAVSLVGEPAVLASTAANAAGVISVVVPIPVGAAPGARILTVTGPGANSAANLTIVTRGDALARTGEPLSGAAGVAAGLLVAGLVFVALGRPPTPDPASP